MMATARPVQTIPPLTRPEAAHLARTENARAVGLVRELAPEDWSKPTDCPEWDARALVSHVLGGFEAFAGIPEFVHQMRAGRRAAGDRPLIDGMTAVQVRDRARMGPEELVAGLERMGPRQARARARVPGPLRRLRSNQDVAGRVESWPLAYLLDVVLTRDTWMHRVDLARATDRPLALTPEHDGRLVADVVADWARRHGQPFVLHLSGPAGATFTQGSGGDELTMDAVTFCRTLSGRAEGTGLMAQQVPF